MPRDRRAFEQIPDNLKTPHNNREYWIADDPLFEPERAEFVIGWIGDTSELSEEDLERTPALPAPTPERQRYQLTIGSTYLDPDTQERLSGAYYQDLVGQIEANGGIVGDDPNRVFETRFYAWAPPIDFDKLVNFGRYFWIGAGAADVNGEFVTKEPGGSRTVIYEWTGSEFVKRTCLLVPSLPASASTGDYAEDSSSALRRIFRYDGIQWAAVEYAVVSNLPVDTSTLDPGDALYVARRGPDYNRPLIWRYTEESGRWHPLSVVVTPMEPDFPREGMVWEDSTIGTERTFKRYEQGVWLNLVYTASQTGPSGVGQDDQYLYDLRDYSSISDEWSARNWWSHIEDLAPADREVLLPEDQATRPILEFWHGIEATPGDTRDERNDFPSFVKYAFSASSLSIEDTGEPTTIYEYLRGTAQDDAVLGFPLVFNETGEFEFELTLESDSSSFAGYKFFKDTITGLVHSVWHKSVDFLQQTQDEDGFWSVPRSITANPDHVTLTTISRSRYLRHFGSVIESQDDFSGSQFGPNSWRWSRKDPAAGATIIDNEQSLLRALALLQTNQFNLPDVIRQIAREYNRVLFKFGNMLDRLWDSNAINGPDGSLGISAAEACDIVLTRLFVGRTAEFPFYYSDMGTYVQTQVAGGIVSVIDPEPVPIFIPPSAPRVGTSKAYTPAVFEDRDGIRKLRAHDGALRTAFGDDRDAIWIELENRFLASIPEDQRTETESFSGRFLSSNFFLQDYVGNFAPNTAIEPVDSIVEDYQQILIPTSNQRVFSTAQGVFAVFSDGTLQGMQSGGLGGTWLLRRALTDDVFLNSADGEYYIFNGKGTHKIERWKRDFEFDYSSGEFKRIIRREFERWIAANSLDFMTNNEFVEGDRFTWNYSSAGIEGHYLGQYRRHYNTARPHSHAWEVMGYSIEPDWWRTQYVPTSTAGDGTPRYSRTHAMWADFQAGIVNPVTGMVREDFKLAAPIPVDLDGELLDPIATGLVDEAALDRERISDTWVYGDGAPVEEMFYESPFYPFTIALASYLMKNGIWTDTVWTEVFIEIGLEPPNQIFNAPHLVHRATLTRPGLAQLPVHLETDSNGDTVQRVGVNAWISEIVRQNGGSVDDLFGRLIRNTQPALSWRTSGFVNGNRTVVRTLSGKEVPFEDVHVVLHESQPVRESFASGILVTREEPGYRVWGYDTFNPIFTVELPAVPVIGGQVTLTESQEATQDQHVFQVEQVTLPTTRKPASDLAAFAVMVDGIPLKPQHVKINSKTEFEIEPLVRIDEGALIGVQVVTSQSNPSTQTRQFTTSQGVAFPYFAKGTGQYVEIEYGRFFESSIDVVNFLIGYGRWLEADGWQFTDVNPDGTDRHDFLWAARTFAEWVVDVESPWNRNPTTQPEDRYSLQVSPFARKAVYSTLQGQVKNIEAVQNGAYGIVNQDAEPIPTDQTMVSRVGDTMTVEAIGESDIFGIRILVTEIEHVIFFSNVTQFNDLMYDPPTAQAHRTLRVDTYRSTGWNGRLEADGFLISGGDLLPNFEKQAKDIIKLYDRLNVVDDPVKYNQAKNLYGWYPADEYMDPIDADERARFDYYRGMIKAKGSRRAFKAYWRATRLGTDSIFLYEEWAWLLGRFGDPRRQEFQFRVGKNDFAKEVQVIAFVNAENSGDTTLEVTPFDRNADPIDGTESDIEGRTGNGRWIRPPLIDDDNDGKANVVFPIDPETEVSDPTAAVSAKLFEEDSLFSVQTYHHVDPAIGKYEPVALSNVDYVTITDPARYNNGPDAAYSGGRVWTEERVGKLWWNLTRNNYADYRSLLPDYEACASQWGRLSFFNATLERDGETVTVTTLDPFIPYDENGDPVQAAHGLAIGQKIDVTGAKPNDYNQQQIEVALEPVSVTGVEMSNTNAAIGTVDFSLTQASGLTSAPTFQAGDGFIIETRSGTQGIVLATGGILDDVIREINTTLELAEVQASNVNGRLGFVNTPGNEGSWFTLRETAYEFGCTRTLFITGSIGGVLQDIEFPRSAVDAAGGAYVGANIDNATNIIDDLRVVQNIFGDTIVEATCSGGHFLAVGDEITISGADQAEYNGTFIIDESVGSGVFQFKNAAAFNIGPGTGSIVYTLSDPSNERFAQNVVIAINRQNTEFSAEYLGANTFRICTPVSRAEAEATTVEFTFNGAPEITTVVVDAASTLTQDSGGGTVPGDYWEIYSAGDTTHYYVWYNVVDATTPNSDPVPGGFDQGVEVQVLAADTADDVASKTTSTVGGLADFAASAVSAVVTVTAVANGNNTDSADVNTGFGVSSSDGLGDSTVTETGGDYSFSQAETDFIDLLTTRAGFTLGATADPDVVETTYPFDKALAGQISTKSSTYSVSLATTADWSLDGLVQLINAQGIPELVAENANGFLSIGNEEGYEGASFLLTGDVFDTAGLDTSLMYGDFPPDSGMAIVVGARGGEFVSEGGTLDAVVEEINTFLMTSSITEIEAVNDDNHLVIRNTTGSKGTAFELAPPAIASIDMLDLVGIAAGLNQPSPFKFQYSINGEPDTPATGTPQVIVGFIDLYEWVRSPVPPSEWISYTASLTSPDAPTGTPFNVDDPSYVSVDTVLSSGATETTYYFWVEKNTGNNPAKDYTTEDLRLRLRSALTSGIPWFAPVDENHMVVYTANQKVVDGNAIEIAIDTRSQETHFEWALIAEGSLFKEVPDAVVDKVLDSMAEEDAQGNTVPDSKLSASERYGSFFLPRQTVFRDPEAARTLYLEVSNRINRRHNFADEERLTSIFPVDGSGDPVAAYWSKARYVEEEYESESIFDSVPTPAGRDERAAAGFYAVGDIVEVRTTEGDSVQYRDLWNPTLFVGALFRYDGDGGFTVVGINDYTIALNEALFASATAFRQIFYALYSLLTTGEKNDLLFPVIYEMQRQSNPCEWCFKTSYVQSQMFQDIYASPFVRPNEFDAVIANIRDVKPFRTKLRSDQVTTTLRELEDVPVNIFEFPDKKITLLFDRLNCAPAEDGGWDGFPWDTEPRGFDTPIWELEDLGRGEYYLANTIAPTGLESSWTIYPDAAPSLYNARVDLYLLGNLVEPDSWPFEIDLIKTAKALIVQASVVVPVEYTIEVSLSWGFYEGSEPTLGPDLEDTLFRPTASSYEHHVARRIGYESPAYRYMYARARRFSGDGVTTDFDVGMEVDQQYAFVDVLVIENQTVEIDGVPTPMGVAVAKVFGEDYVIPVPGTIRFLTPPPAPPAGWEDGNVCAHVSCNPNIGDPEGLPQERIKAAVVDSLNICVKTFDTEAYGFWDSTGWDTTPWDTPPTDVGPRSFRILVGPEEIIPPGVEVLPTSEDITTTGSLYVFASSSRYGISGVYVQSGGVGPFVLATEGVDYVFAAPFSHIVRFDDSYGLVAGDVVRFVYGSWVVGKLGSFRITSTPVPMDYSDYRIVAQSSPPIGGTILVEYVVDHRVGQPKSLLSGVEHVYENMVDAAADLNPVEGSFDETAYDGMLVVAKDVAQAFSYNATTGNYSAVAAIPVGQTFLVSRLQEIWQYDGASFNRIFRVGDPGPTPPVLTWPPFGIGVAVGPYYLGVAPGAATQWPEAKQIVDSPYGCTDYEPGDPGTPEDLVACGYEPPEGSGSGSGSGSGGSGSGSGGGSGGSTPAPTYKGVYIPGCCP